MLLNPFLSAFFLETTSLPLRYQSISIQYSPRTLLPISRRSFAEYPPPLHPTLYTLHPTPFTFSLKNLHIRKFCCTFAARNPTRGCLRFWQHWTILNNVERCWTTDRGFADILKRRLLRSVLAVWNLANFRNNQDLATIDALRDIDYPSCAYFGTPFAYMRMRARVP